MEYIKASWYDLKHSPGYIGRVCVIALLSLVPILNMFLIGYAIRWGVDLLKGKRETLPSTILNEQTFVFGLFYVLLSMVVGALIGFMCFTIILIVIVPFVGCLFTLLVQVAILRAALLNQLEPAFQLKTIWAVCKRDIKGLAMVSLVPYLIYGLAVTLLSLVFFVPIITGIGITSSEEAAIMLGLLFAFTVFIFSFVVVFGSVMTYLLSIRATAYWLACHAPEWAQEAAYLALPYQVRRSMEQQAVQPSAQPMAASTEVPAAPVAYTAPQPTNQVITPQPSEAVAASVTGAVMELQSNAAQASSTPHPSAPQDAGSAHMVQEQSSPVVAPHAPEQASSQSDSCEGRVPEILHEKLVNPNGQTDVCIDDTAVQDGVPNNASEVPISGGQEVLIDASLCEDMDTSTASEMSKPAVSIDEPDTLADKESSVADDIVDEHAVETLDAEPAIQHEGELGKKDAPQA